MKAKELMIGDWVRNDLGEYQTVVELRESGAMLAYNDIYPYDAIEPIPITPEILEKNGFVPDNFSPYYLPIEDGSIRFSEHQYGLYCNILRSYQRYDGVCNYIHELQHALRLCGIDKEITI